MHRYQREQAELFNQVIAIIRSDFLNLIKQQALTGQVIVRSENPIFFANGGLPLTMALDVLSERGYRVVLDYLKEKIPEKINLETGEISNKNRKIFVFNISFPTPKIRHAVADSKGWDDSVVI